MVPRRVGDEGLCRSYNRGVVRGYETAIVLVVNAGSMICRWPVADAPEGLWDEVI